MYKAGAIYNKINYDASQEGKTKTLQNETA